MEHADPIPPQECPYCDRPMEALPTGGYLCRKNGIYISRLSIVQAILDLRKSKETNDNRES
jgi:hypothetical protein